ncbi:protein jag [Patescibacteria group bacterium]
MTVKKETKSKKNQKKVNQLTVVKKLASKLVKNLKVKAQISVTEDDQGLVHVQIETEDPGVLIGYHGETLSSLQLILAMMLYRQTEEWIRILINVGDYRERRRESLLRMAMSAVQRVKFSNESQALPSMSSAERRIIHMELANYPEVETESEGEGSYRRVVVKPKT